MQELSFEAFRSLAAGSTRLTVPVWRDVPLHAPTPAAAFARLRDGPFAFLLESAGGGSGAWARYTFIGSGARRAWRLRDCVVEDWLADRGWHGARTPADPLHELQDLAGTRAGAADPTPFWSGAAGYVGYDVVRHLERLPNPPPRDTSIPDAMFVVPAAVVTLDRLTATARVVVPVEVGEGQTIGELRRIFDAAIAEIDAVVARLRTGGSALPEPDTAAVLAPAAGRSSRAQGEFMRDVDRCKEYIRAGDAFQIVLTRRVELEHDFDSLALYRSLRAINPSPYMYHLAFDGVELVGSSPELFVRVADNRVTVRPIAGTRPRPGTPEADDRTADELRSDPKERAEHLMLVDLGRNDIGRVSRFGTVHVDKLMEVERYSHVLHLVSDISGELRPGCTAVDALRATFPTGTLTGAPKVRAMEIIDELEPVRRGPYAGAVGFIGSGARDMNMAVTIRTCVIADGRAFVQAGAGIVADSVPEKEWEESARKAEALLVAIAHARAGSRTA